MPCSYAACLEFLKTFCEDTDFLATRRKILRLRAGLKETDRKLAHSPEG